MINSAQNAKVKRVRRLLQDRQERRQEGMYVLEGVRLVEEAANANVRADLVLYSTDLSTRGRDILTRFTSMGVPCEEVEARILRSLSDTESSQGILAVVQQPAASLPDEWDLLLVLDQIRDPGNMGTILRSAAASAVQGVMLTPGSIDAFAPKVVRAAMGAHLKVPILSLEWPQILTICREKLPHPASILVADSSRGVPCWQADLRQPLALVIGSEAEGPQPVAYSVADGLVHIPMPGKTESLNAAMATSILLYEVIRQRMS